MSPIAICFAPSSREASNSQGSRTSSSVNVSPRFCSALTWLELISNSRVGSALMVVAVLKSSPRPTKSRENDPSGLLTPYPHRVRSSHRSQAHQRRQRPQRTSANARVMYLAGWNRAPQRQTQTNCEVHYQHAEKQTFAQTPRIERQSDEHEYPHDVGRSGPGVVRPVRFVPEHATVRDPGKVPAGQKSHDSPRCRAAHEVARTVGTLRHGRGIRHFYLPVHFGDRFSMK